jgi:hypothetical protein
MPLKDHIPEFVAEINDDLTFLQEAIFVLHGKPEETIEAQISKLAEAWANVYQKIGEFNRLCGDTRERHLINKSRVGKWYFTWLNPLMKELYPELNTPISIRVQETLWLWFEEEWLNYEASQWFTEYRDRCKFHAEVTSPEINEILKELEQWKKVRHFRAAETKINQLEEKIALLKAEGVLKKNPDLARRAIGLSLHVSKEFQKDLETDAPLYKMLQLIPQMRTIIEEIEANEKNESEHVAQLLDSFPTEYPGDTQPTQQIPKNGRKRSKSGASI